MTDANSTMTNDAFRVRRRIGVPDLHGDEDALKVKALLSSIDGVLRVSVDSETGRVTLDYLQTRTDYRALEDLLSAAGFSPARGHWARIRQAWLTNLDETARANAAAPQAACCSHPPGRAHTRDHQ